MKKHLCVLVLGLFHALHGAEINSDNVGSEAKDIVFRDGTFNPLFYKREATKITNTDSPSFNYLKSSTSLTPTPSSGGFKPSSPPKIPPFRFIQSSQLQQSSPLVSYFQSAHPATEVAAQYLQAIPVSQYQFQTPTQVQYVATPTVAQYPFVKFQNLGSQFAAGNAGSEASASNAATTSSQYLTSAQQALTSGSSLGTASSGSQASLTSSTPAKQFALQQSSQALFSAQQQQQPFLTFYQLQPQVAASNFLYQQQPSAANFYLSQQPQHFLSFYPASRFGFYSPVQGTQLSYVVPLAQAQGAQDSTSANEVKPSSEQKSSSSSSSSSQQATSSTATTFGTKV